MMEDLNKSTFFDKRITDFVRKLLYNPYKATPISNFEIQLQERIEELISLNSYLKGDLVNLLEQSKNYIPMTDSLFFLLHAQKIGEIDEAKEALTVATYEKKSLDRESLKTLLKESKQTPMSWAVSLIGENEDERYQEQPKTKSGIDLSRLRDFK